MFSLCVISRFFKDINVNGGLMEQEKATVVSYEIGGKPGVEYGLNTSTYSKVIKLNIL